MPDRCVHKNASILILSVVLMIVLNVPAPIAVPSATASVRSLVRRSTPVAVNGPFLVTGMGPGLREATLYAVSRARPLRILATSLPPQTEIAPSPRGRYVALAEGARGLWLVRSDGTGLRRLLTPPASAAPRTHRLTIDAVAWSPDRHTLAYAVGESVIGQTQGGYWRVNEPDTHAGLWLVRDDGRHPRQIATAARVGFALSRLSWSSGGRFIAYMDKGAVSVLDLITGQTQVGVAPGLGAFSPHTPVLVYTGENCRATRPATAFCQVDAHGSHRRRVGEDATPAARPQNNGPLALAWSPDGHQLAYLLAGSGRRLVLHTLDVVTGQVHVVPLSTPLRGPLYGFPALAWQHATT